MSPQRIELTCPDALGHLVRVTALPSVAGQVMVLGPRGGFRLSREDLDQIGQLLSDAKHMPLPVCPNAS